MSMSTRCQDRCPAVEKPASLQQAPGGLHVETWAGREGNPSLSISQLVEIVPRCADMVTRLLPPFFSSVSPGPGRVRNGISWNGENSFWGVGVSGCFVREQCIFCICCICQTGFRKDRFLQHGRSSPLSSSSCSYAYGQGTAVGPQSGKRCWPLLTRPWRALAPLMKPWCAEGESAYCCEPEPLSGRSSHVGWHSDDEPLFGRAWGSKAHCLSEHWDPGAFQMEG